MLRVWRYLRPFVAATILAIVGLTQSVIGADAPGAAESARAFSIFKERCSKCHSGPEAKHGLVLIDPAGIARGSKRGKVIKPGDTDSSPLWQKVSADEMPPETPLAADEKQILRAWIAAGAPGLPGPADSAASGAATATHWAFVPPQRSSVPAVSIPEWAADPIDGFVLGRLEKEGLKPSPTADRVTLLRRLSLDLTGLPPSLDEIKAVEADTVSGWYEAALNRLLASPHYGETWARHWMDAAQYADSDGFEKDKPRAVWAWRDWVIQAFNNNMPYDRFVIEQVAGDLLPNATQDQIVATGFLRNSMINEEGGIDPEQFRMEAQFNRMDIIGRAVLGLTVQCAQCHSHKYDPLTHTDYYRMFAFLNNEHEACMTVLSPVERQETSEILKMVKGLEDRTKSENRDWRERMAAWETKMRARAKPTWETLQLTFDDTSAGGQKCIAQGDDSYLAQGYAPTQFGPKMTAKTKLTKVSGVRLELLPDPNLPRGGPGRSIYGACALSEFEMRFTKGDMPIAEYDKWTPVEFSSAVADVNPPVRQLSAEFPVKGKKENRVTGPVAMAIDKKSETAWSTDIDPLHRNEAHCAIFKLKEPLEIEPGTSIAFRPQQQHGGWNSDDNQNNNIGRFRISATDAEELPTTILPQAVEDALTIPAWDRNGAQNQTVFDEWRATVPEWSEMNARIASLLQAIPSGTTQLVMKERDHPRETHRLNRGDFLKPAEAVTAGVPGYLNPLKVEGKPTRLDFARWLVARDSPTTARAFVNRVWQHCFGQGLVVTSSDFGMQGEPPSHPELLDWLAVEFMDSGWDVKRLHRLIVTSATYKQASNASSELLERDPHNRLLARGARFRLEGESVRDVALAASGLLNPAVGGPSVHPAAPEYLFLPPASYGPKSWHVEQGAAQYRRALYTFRFRSVPYPALQVFDAPPGDAPCTRRVMSNTPLQALTMLNEPLFFSCARGLAELTLSQGGADEKSRIDFAFRRCTARDPDVVEAEKLKGFLARQEKRIAAGELKPEAILNAAGGNSAAENKAELAAWTLTARAILSLDETITRQ